MFLIKKITVVIKYKPRLYIISDRLCSGFFGRRFFPILFIRAVNIITNICTLHLNIIIVYSKCCSESYYRVVCRRTRRFCPLGPSAGPKIKKGRATASNLENSITEVGYLVFNFNIGKTNKS